MKKLLIIAISAIALSTFAQTGHRVQSFLNDKVASIIVSNAAGTVIVPGITNLNSTIANGLGGYGTNNIGTTWTNKDGSYVNLTAANMGTATNDHASDPLFKDVDLWSTREAGMATVWAAGTGSAGSNNVVVGTITMKLIGRSGKSGTVNLRFCPLYDGTNEPNTVADPIVWGVAVNGATPVVISTNIYQYRVPGAKRLRLREIYNSDTGAGTDAYITDLNISGFVP